MAISSTRLVFLSTGKYTSTAHYTPFSKTNLQTMPHATGFVISLSNNYNIYQAGPYADLIDDVINQAYIIADPDISKPFYIGLPVVDFSYSYNNRSADYARLRDNYIIPIWN